MKKQIATALAALLLLPQVACAQPEEPTKPSAQEHYRSDKVRYDDVLLTEAEDAATAEVWQAGAVGSCQAALEELAGTTLQVRLLLEDETTTYREFSCREGELIWERQTDGQFGSGCYKKFDSDFYLRLITLPDSESIAQHLYTVDRFPTDCDLENLSAADAKDALQSVLARIGLQTDDAHITAYALQKEPLQALAEERKAAGMLDPIVWTDADGNRIVKDPESWYKEFTDEDACFYLSAAVLLDGIPLFSSCNVTAIYGADGFVYLSLPCILKAEEATQTVTLCSADRAMSLLHSHYENSTVGVTADVVQMELVYYPLWKDGVIYLTPAWHFLTIEHQTDAETDRVTDRGAEFYFDAATGERLTEREEGEAG